MSEHIDWDAYEQELADVDGTPVLVDSEPDPNPQLVPGGARRRPVLPAWLKSARAARDMVRWAVGYAWHTFLFHLVRVPVYGVKLAGRSPRGLWRVVRGGFRWGFDLEGEPVRQAAVRREDAHEYLKLSAQRDSRVRLRTFVGLAGMAVLCGCGWWWTTLAGWQRYGLLAALVIALGALGAPADKPLLDRAVVSARVARLTSDVVTRALGVLGLAGINQAMAKSGNAVGFAAPITRDGPGWRADIDLPAGVTAGEVIDRREKLASGLGRPLGCVWPEAAHDVHPGRLVLWVGDQDMATTRQPAWPLLKAATADLFKPFPFGTDPRGRTVSMDLVFTNLLIGSIPGYGKTMALKLPLLATALDPTAELWVFELKGTGDLEPLAKVATRYASSADDDAAEAALIALRDLRKECAKRAEVIKGLPKNVCPENKVTPELARRKSLGLHLLVVAIDECQELFSHPEFGKEAGELAEKVIKLGRALGVILALATQRPDAKSLPTGVSSNVGTRFGLRVMGQVENDMILGTSAYKNGIRSTMFVKRDKGVGYLVGAADEPQIVKTFYVDGPTADRICDRARAAREAAGTLAGQAIGQQVTRSRRDTLLDDIATVVPASEAKVWSETVVERLAELHPEHYQGWTPEQLASALKPYGIDTAQIGRRVEGRTVNRRGISRQDITAAITSRNQRRSDG